MTNYRNYSKDEMIDMIFFADMESPEFTEWEKALENDEELFKNAKEIEKYFFSNVEQDIGNIISPIGDIQIISFGEISYYQPKAQGVPERIRNQVTNKEFPQITLNFEKDASSGNYKIFMLGGEYKERIKMVIEIHYKDTFTKDVFLGKETALGGHWEIEKKKIESVSTIVWKLEE